MSERKLPRSVLVGAVWIAALVAFFGTLWLGPRVVEGSTTARLIVGTVIGLLSLGLSLGLPIVYYRFQDREQSSIPKL